MVWSWLYDTKSFLQEGTLCHLRNLIDRRNISATAADDFNACEDFFVTVVHSHIVAATMDYLQMKTVKDTPIHPVLKEGIWLESDDERRDALDVISKEIVKNYVDILAHNNLDEDIQQDKVMSYKVGIMALTATATKQVRENVQGLLGMRDPLCIIQSPDKDNILFTSIAIKGYNTYEVSNIFNLILEELRPELTTLPRIIVFCKLHTF